MIDALTKCSKGALPTRQQWKRPALMIPLVVIAMSVIGILVIQNQPGPQAGQTVFISSEPPDASIFLDNRLVGQTPLDSLLIDPGEHTIGLVKEGFERRDTGFIVGQGADIAVSLKLRQTASKTTLTVLSTPTGAKAYLDGEFIGITPVSSYPASPGVRRLRIVRDGFASWDSTVDIRDNQNISASITLRRNISKATLVLGAVPNGTASVNGESRSVTGTFTTTFQLSPGTHSVVFRHPEYGPKTASLKLESGQSTTLVCHFETRVSIVSNSDAGSPIPSLILVNGKSMGNEAPGVIRLGPGKYKIGVAKTGYQMNEPEKEITLTPSLDGQKEIEVVFTLKKL